jgi:hypothetical protein
MTRKDIEAEYDVLDGTINSPGKFEGEATYVPYFWDAYLNGGADEDDSDVLTFNVDDSDIAEFPELTGRKTVRILQTDDGFVCEV